MENIGNYSILETISVKGPSSVYIARHNKLNRKTFLKVYQGQDSTIIERFEREAKIVADLNSTSIVQVYDFGEADGKYYISMEFVEGMNLAEFLRGNPEDLQLRLDYCHQIAHAVSLLHKKGYIHRDLKPENILLTQSGQVKLTDFGLTLHESLKRITSEGALLGTPLYMSPEQINNTTLSPASDVFALGIIFYQLVTGTHPFEAEQYSQVFSKILTFEPQRVDKFQPDLPGWLVDLIARMLSKEAIARPADAVQVCLHFPKDAEKSAEPAVDEAELPSSKKRSIFYLVLFLVLLIFFTTYLSRFFAPVPEIPTDTLNSAQDSIVSLDSTLQDTVANAVQNSQSADATQIPGLSTEIKTAPNQLNSKPTTLLVETYPWCNIYLDYELVDKTPMTTQLELKPGSYILGLQNPLYPSLSDTITVEAHKNNLFTYNLDSTFLALKIQVMPWGKIYIDGRYVQTTPLQAPIYVTRENHFIEIRNNFCKSWSDSIKWHGQSEIRLAVDLEEK